MPEQDVRARIEAAFAETPPPGDAFEDISATKCDEGIVEYFRGRSWRGHLVRDLRHHGAALSCFTDKAFRYWLPAFMLAELEDSEEADVVAETIASIFIRGRPQARLCQFTRGELEAVAAFLGDCARRSDSDNYERHFRKGENAVRTRLHQA